MPDRTGLAAALHRVRSQVPTGLLGSVEMLAAALFGLAVVTLYAQNPVDRFGLVLELLLCVSAGVIARWPIPASLAAAVLLAALLGATPGVARASMFAMLLVIASLGARGYRALSLGSAAWFFVIGTLGEMNPPRPLLKLFSLAFGWALFAVLAWLLGRLLDQVNSAERSNRAARRAAVASQRRLIARDLHDTVAYGITSMILRAEQVKLRGVDDESLRADLDYMIATGRRSMRDLRGMMEELRRTEELENDDSPWQPRSLDETLHERVATLRRHGFVVTVGAESDVATLPEPVRETLAKVIVEATSNILKHGDPAGPCSILIDVSNAAVELVFINRPNPADDGLDRTAGLGLVGVRERLESLGGELEFARHENSFILRVLVPLKEQ